jgi:hypothetical protein
MALRLRVLLWMLVLAVLVGLRDSEASGRQKYVLKDPSCAIKVYVGKTWQPTEGVWREGEVVLGSPASAKADVLYLFHRGRTYASPLKCWTLESGERATPSASQGVGFVYLNWQERVKLTESASGAVYDLRANQSGWGISYSRVFKQKGSWRFGMMSTLFSASSALLNSCDPNSTIVPRYCSEDASALGVILAPEIEWQRGGEGSSVGITLPVAARLTNWASPEGYVISGTQKLLYGPLLSVKLHRQAWEFSSRLGFLNSTQNLAWILGVSRSL